MNDWDPFSVKSTTTMSPQSSYRMKKDISAMLNEPLAGILIEPDETDFLRLHVLITGPEGTPYEKGFFHFVVGFPTNYPFASPKLRLMTTGGGKVRFNPNLYSSGKVCLSILGTYPGPKWTASLGIQSVLLNIQALLTSAPYTNEPGFEKEKHPGDIQAYNDMLTHETLRVAVMGHLQDGQDSMPDSFRQYIRNKFLQYCTFYESVIFTNITKTGLPIKDPLYHQDYKEFQYDHLLDKIESIKCNLQQSST